MRRIRVMLAALVFLSCPILAADIGKPDSHTQAAEELLTLMHLDTVMNQTTDVMLKAQIQQNPALSQVEDIMRAFFAKYLNYEAVKPQFLRMYTDAFTEAELRQMTAFYRTDTGRKCLTVMPTLMQKGAGIGVELLQQHQDELKAAITARFQELGQKGGKTAPSE